MALFLSTRREGDWTLVEARGRLDITTARELHECLDLMFTDNPSTVRLILDLTGLTSCDVGGLGALVGARNRVGRNGGELRLVSPEGRVRRTLHVSHLDRVLYIYRTLEEACGDPHDHRDHRDHGRMELPDVGGVGGVTW